MEKCINGVTYQTITATFSQYAKNSGTSYEQWGLKAKIPTTITKFIISSITYKVNGATYVDTNFGNKYIINFPLTHPQI